MSHCQFRGSFFAFPIAGEVDEIIFEAQTLQLPSAGEYQRHSEFINGLPNFSCVVREHIKVHDSKMVTIRPVGGHDKEVEFHNFPPGSAVALRYVIIYEFDLAG